MNLTMQFDAIAEPTPGEKWQARWNRSWPDYQQWFISRGGNTGPSRSESEAALHQYMPELVPLWKSLSRLAGNDDMAARFLSTWCPPAYLGGCSLAAITDKESTHLVRNYDLSPELNEGLLLRTEWTGTPVMGMVEFLWGLSDGINEHGLAVALAFGGSSQTGKGFGITTILRYVLETCITVEQALSVLKRVPSHMAYNIIIADASGASVVTELKAGGGMTLTGKSISTNHQHGSPSPDNATLTQTFERFDYLEQLIASGISPDSVADEFLKPPIFQDKYSDSMGTLFTADYNPVTRTLDLRWPHDTWSQSLDNFQERTQCVTFSPIRTISTRQAINIDSSTPENEQWLNHLQSIEQYATDKHAFLCWIQKARTGDINWTSFSHAFTGSRARNLEACKH